MIEWFISSLHQFTSEQICSSFRDCGYSIPLEENIQNHLRKRLYSREEIRKQFEQIQQSYFHYDDTQNLKLEMEKDLQTKLEVSQKVEKLFEKIDTNTNLVNEEQIEDLYQTIQEFENSEIDGLQEEFSDDSGNDDEQDLDFQQEITEIKPLSKLILAGQENISREQLIKQVYGKDESELSELELNGIEAFYQDQDRDDSELQQQAKNDYELQQNNQLFFILKRLKQGYDKGGIGFAAQKAKEIFIDKPLDYVVNNPVSKFVQDVYNFLISLIKNKYLFLIGFVAIIIFIKKV
ncbi:hypothetical protein ABPG72_012119 [Tetrahymena utriculariae]